MSFSAYELMSTLSNYYYIKLRANFDRQKSESFSNIQ